MGKVAHLRAAELGRQGDAEQAERAEFFPQIGREQIVVVDLRRTRGDFLLGEGSHGVAQQIDVFAERKGTHGGQLWRMRPRKRGWPMYGSLTRPIRSMRSSAMRSAAL